MSASHKRSSQCGRDSTAALSHGVNRLRTKLVLQQPVGLWTNVFDWDAGLRLTNVISPAGSFNYDLAAGGVTHHARRITLPNTSYITNIYDGNARLTSERNRTSSDVVPESA